MTQEKVATNNTLEEILTELKEGAAKEVLDDIKDDLDSIKDNTQVTYLRDNLITIKDNTQTTYLKENLDAINVNTQVTYLRDNLIAIKDNTQVTYLKDNLDAIAASVDNIDTATEQSASGSNLSAKLTNIFNNTQTAYLKDNLDAIKDNTQVTYLKNNLDSIVSNTSAANLKDKLTDIETAVNTVNTSVGTSNNSLSAINAAMPDHIKSQQEVLLYAGTTDYYTGTNVDSNFLGYVQNTRGITVYVTEYRLQIICLTVAASPNYDRFWDSTTSGGAFTIGQGSSTAAGTFGNSYVFNNSNIFAFLESTYTAATETFYNFVFPCRIHCPDQNYIKWKINGKMPVTSKYSVVARYEFLG